MSTSLTPLAPVTSVDRLGEHGLHVAGEVRAASGAGRFPVLDPATGQVLAHVADGTVEDAVETVRVATEAFATWSASPPMERSRVLQRTADLMEERADELAALISAENGKALPDAMGEVRYSADFFRWFAGEALRLDGTSRRSPSGQYWILTRPEPVGVVALVTPWNFPAAMIARKVAPAVAAGCTAVVKPAAETPLTALAMVALMEEAGLPAGVVNVLTSRRSSEVVQTLMAAESVRKISFTGSTQVGKVLMHQAADRVMASSMELGGNAPFVVFEDADMEVTLQGALQAKMRGCGQACTAANRFLVHESVAEEFTARLVETMAAMTVADGRSPGAEVGPLASMRARDGVAALVDEAVERGARVRLGGAVPDGEGYFYPPTVLSGVAHDDPLLATEIFGPVASVTTFADEEEAVRLANASEYGLAAYVFSADVARAMRVAGRLESGMVAVNRGLLSDAAAPFGGVKESGLGREGGSEGIAEYLETKYIAVEF